MPAERFYVNDPDLSVDKLIALEKDEFHHLFHVMRLKTGETAQLINGTGSLATALVFEIEKHKAILQIQSLQTETPPAHKIILAQALPRLSKLEYIIEKGVELGITDLWLFPGTLSEKKELSPSQVARVHHITLSAMKQCGRLFLPNIIFCSSLLTWTTDNIPANAFFGDTDPAAPPFLTSLQSLDSSSIFIAIGPEKGFQEKEVHYMEKNLSLKPIKLHRNILRTETAAVHAVSLSSTFILKD